MTSHKAKDHGTTEDPAKTGQNPASGEGAREESGKSSHYVTGHGAPGGTSDDDGDSENRQGDSGHGTAKPSNAK